MDLFQEAAEHHKKGEYAEAEKRYDMLLSQNHDNAGLLATLGTLYLQTGKYGLAIHLLEQALVNKALKASSDVISNLSLAYKNSGQGEKALRYIEKACSVPDPCAGALANYSGFFTNTGTPDKAIELCNLALAKNPEMVVAHWNLALALLEKGEWERGWREHEWGLRMAKHASTMRIDRKIGDLPTWDGTPGKTVVIYGEQGLGDEIMFASMYLDVMAVSNLVIECHKRLITLFERSFGVPCYGTREDTEIGWHNNHQLDYRLSSGSLGQFFRNSAQAFPGMPYLRTEAVPRGSKFRIGISWTGGGKAGRIQTRAIPLSWWKPILDNDCEFVSLQYTDQAAEIDIVEKLGYKITQYPFMANRTLDYDETAKVVKSCDLVISVCTSLVHLSGALGVPCWVMVPNKPAWRYGAKGHMPWYRSVRLYRQNMGDGWSPVIEKVALDLADLLKSKQGQRMSVVGIN